MDPSTVAQTANPFDPNLATLFGYLNIFAGIMLVISVLLFVAGYVYFFARMGLDSVTTGFDYMRYGVVVLFFLVVMLGIVHYIQYNSKVVLVLLSIAATIVLLFVILKATSAPAEEKKE